MVLCLLINLFYRFKMTLFYLTEIQEKNLSSWWRSYRSSRSFGIKRPSFLLTSSRPTSMPLIWLKVAELEKYGSSILFFKWFYHSWGIEIGEHNIFERLTSLKEFTFGLLTFAKGKPIWYIFRLIRWWNCFYKTKEWIYTRAWGLLPQNTATR